MRLVRRKPGRRKRRPGCIGGLLRFFLFLAVVVTAGILVSRGYFNSDMAEKIKKTQYPIKYEHFVEKYSEEYKLDKYLVFAVIRTESRFDKYAVSRADAKGLMQLTDETGEECAKKLGVSKYTPDALFDPEINIQLGCYYLRRLLDNYDNVDTALAAYNGGPGNVDLWLKDKNYSDGFGGLTNIPFEETKKYVLRVRDAWGMYKNIYDKQE